MSEMSKIKGHPAFLVFSSANVKQDKTVDTGAAKDEEAKQEIKDDQKYNGGGEKSKG